ncbi:hypothetical protein [Streptomyces sp. NBRC 109706]|uniref:hypothetical protein n=1 Tax=Streptomyces sp. NBRC 109706 TaxID=1550035 RepID=UPI00078551FB|nr:hypothetical protein [Streptomyces sp. NBRC 109706]
MSRPYTYRCALCGVTAEPRRTRRQAQDDQTEHRAAAHHGLAPDGERIDVQLPEPSEPYQDAPEPEPDELSGLDRWVSCALVVVVVVLFLVFARQG